MRAPHYFAVLALAAILLPGCGSSGGAAGSSGNGPAIEAKAKLPASTPVRLVLLSDLAAGRSKVGERVIFLVGEDVRSSDRLIAIPKGSLAEGEVAWSRSEGMLSAAMNRPARLTVKLLSLRLPGGGTVPLSAAPDGKSDEPYAFDRGNTQIQRVADEVAEMVKGAEQSAVETLAQSLDTFLQTGDAGALNSSEASREALSRILQAPEFDKARSLMANGNPEKSAEPLSRLIREARGGSVASLAAPELALALGALQEFGKLVGSIDAGLGRVFRGRTLRAHPGTDVQAYLASDFEVSVQVGGR